MTITPAPPTGRRRIGARGKRAGGGGGIDLGSSPKLFICSGLNIRAW
jgi:hypothetical protein